MKLKFKQQEFQNEAVKSVTNLFKKNQTDDVITAACFRSHQSKIESFQTKAKSVFRDYYCNKLQAKFSKAVPL
ncbi:hypothetical protein [Bartonella birtlesii]|uniref:Uncharacterized protein n=1 Tax=Bartonella birtlesii LL-WM9 TaxID=1094552 RepID=J0Q6H1_9HYPH|nr:hypothetical protein [Bartonella birtlesii]EJF78239.1 hypothetical protein ME7_00230 [Bartonella birtlesii LL-WM9]